MIVAGIGCRRGTPAEDLLAAIDAAASTHAIARDAIGLIAVLDIKAGEPGVRDAAKRLGRALTVIDRTQSSSVSGATLSVSRHSLAATGTGSASETAALAAAGTGARLLGPRVIAGNATCALAIGDGPA